MRAAAVAATLLATACAASRPAQTPAGEAPAASRAARTAPPEAAPVTVEALLRRTPAEGSVVVRLATVRAHPLGGRVEPFVLAWPGWGTTIAAITPHPVDELDWITVVGPRDPAHERMMARTSVADDVIDGRLRDRSDGTLRVVVRAPAHAVIAIPPDDAQAVVPSLADSRVVDPPAEGDEALHVDFPEPHAMIAAVPAEVHHLDLRAWSRPGGAGEAIAELACDDEATAARVADELRGRVDRLNNFAVRILTRDLLSAVSIETRGTAVQARLPATREQLESLATLAAGMLPAGSGKPPP